MFVSVHLWIGLGYSGYYQINVYSNQETSWNHFEKTASVPEKKSPGKPINRFASATWKKFNEKLSLWNKDKRKKGNVPSKKSILHEQNPVKNYHEKKKRKKISQQNSE